MGSTTHTHTRDVVQKKTLWNCFRHHWLRKMVGKFNDWSLTKALLNDSHFERIFDVNFNNKSLLRTFKIVTQENSTHFYLNHLLNNWSLFPVLIPVYIHFFVFFIKCSIDETSGVVWEFNFVTCVLLSMDPFTPRSLWYFTDMWRREKRAKNRNKHWKWK